ncbi:MAG: hypothetical protein IKK89_00635 [Alistipes sp.]|nr:hypothetical protein [Alistipes sp.]
MKARLKGDDKEREFVLCFCNGEFVGCCLKEEQKNSSNMNIIPRELLVFPEDDKEATFPNKVDWEQRRYELAKDFLARCNFTYDVYESCVKSPATAADTIAKASVMMADALIKLLRKDETEQSD